MEQFAAKGKEAVPLPGYDPDERTDRINAISGLDFKVKLPTISDSDPDLEKHMIEFEAALQCHAHGRSSVRAYDRLTLYKKTLQPNGVRFGIYEREFKRAQRKGRLPAKAQEVFELIVETQKKRIAETILEKQTRIDKKFNNLEMGRMSHAEFRGAFEDCLDDHEEAGKISAMQRRSGESTS